MECLVFLGKTFAPLGAHAPDDCHGFFERNGDHGVHLYKTDDKASLEAYIVSNVQQGHFIVSASSMPEGPRYMFGASRQVHLGRTGQVGTPEGPRYMYGASSLTKKWLGTYEMGMEATQDAIQGIRYVEVQEQHHRERHG